MSGEQRAVRHEGRLVSRSTNPHPAPKRQSGDPHARFDTTTGLLARVGGSIRQGADDAAKEVARTRAIAQTMAEAHRRHTVQAEAGDDRWTDQDDGHRREP